MKNHILLFMALALSSPAFALDPQPDISTTDVCTKVRYPLPDATYSHRAHNTRIKPELWKSRLTPMLKYYRDLWLKVCAKDEGTSLNSLYEIYPKVLSALGSASTAPFYAIPGEFAEDWHYKQSAVYLPFISSTLKPESTTLYEFKFDLKSYFAFTDKWGKLDDKIFGYVMTNVSGLSHEPMWSFSAGSLRKSCAKFGEYNWYAGFEILKKSQKYFTTTYKIPLSKIRNGLLSVFDVAARKDICACGDLESVKKDFENLKIKAASDPYYVDVVEAIKSAQSKMMERDFHFGSYMNNSCSPRNQ